MRRFCKQTQNRLVKSEIGLAISSLFCEKKGKQIDLERENLQIDHVVTLNQS